MVYSTRRFVLCLGGPGVSLTLCCFVGYSTRRFVLCLTMCYFVLVFFSALLALQLPRLGKRELILVIFVRLFDLCLFRFVGFPFSWCLGRAAVRDCGTPWTFLLTFFPWAHSGYPRMQTYFMQTTKTLIRLHRCTC